MRGTVTVAIAVTLSSASVGQRSKWTQIHRTCTSKSKGGVTERLKLLDAVGRACEILPPDSASAGSPAFHPFPTPVERLLSAEDPPFDTKPEVKRRRVYFALTLPPLILEFSSSSLFILYPQLSPSYAIPFPHAVSNGVPSVVFVRETPHTSRFLF